MRLLATVPSRWQRGDRDGSDDRRRGTRKRRRPGAGSGRRALERDARAGDRMASRTPVPNAAPKRISVADRSRGPPPPHRVAGERYPDLVPVDRDHYVHGYEVAAAGWVASWRPATAGSAAWSPSRSSSRTRRSAPPARARGGDTAGCSTRPSSTCTRPGAGRRDSPLLDEAGRRALAGAGGGRGRPLRERLALLPNLIAMVEAVAYAHRQLIILATSSRRTCSSETSARRRHRLGLARTGCRAGRFARTCRSARGHPRRASPRR